jgi:muramoyltetrapeptide carboxypeptidase
MILQSGDKIGIIAPAYHLARHQWEPVVPLLQSWGLQVVLGKSLCLQDGLFAGNDEQRLADLTDMMRNPDIKAVLCARGGYGTGRLLPEIDRYKSEFGVKWIIGYSDISVLLTYWYHQLHQPCIHGNMPVDLQESSPEASPSWEYLRRVLFGQMPAYTLLPTVHNRLGFATAPVVGGNLSVLYSLNGSPYQCQAAGCILFIEDVNESLYHLDRMMNNFRIGGQLSRLKGLLVGNMTGMKDNPPFGKTHYEIIRWHVAGYDYPVAFDFPAGHGGVNFPIVMGATMRLSVTGETVTAIQSIA